MPTTPQSVQEHGQPVENTTVVYVGAERKHSPFKTLAGIGALGAIAYIALNGVHFNLPDFNLGKFDSHVEFGEVDVMVNDVVGTTDLRLATATETIDHEIKFKNSIPLFPDANQKYTTHASVNVDLCVTNNNGKLTGMSFTPVSEDGESVDAVRIDLDLGAVHTCDVTFNPEFCTENEDGTERECEPTKIGEYSASELQQWADAAKGNQETRDGFRSIAISVVVGAAQFSGECIAKKIGDETAQQIFFHDILHKMFRPVFEKFGIPLDKIIVNVTGELGYIPADAVHYDMYNSSDFVVKNPTLQCEEPVGQ